MSISGNCASGNARRSFSTQCLRSMTAVQKQITNTAAMSADHQNMGTTQASHGIDSPTGTPR